MKKLARAAALPVLAVLLSACATSPGGVENQGSGGLNDAQKKAVEKAVEKALDNPGPGGLQKAVEKAVEKALNNPGPGGLQKAVEAEVKAELGDLAGYRELKVGFVNLVAKGRDDFVKKLDKMFKRMEERNEDRKLTRDPLKFGTVHEELSSVTFTLRDPWGIPGGELKTMQNEIAKAAVSTKVDISVEGMPLSEKVGSSNVRFQDGEVSYVSAGGESKITAKVEDDCEIDYRITVPAKPVRGASAQTPIALWVYNTRTGKSYESTGEDILANIVGVWEENTGICKLTEEKLQGSKWYIMAYTKKRGDDPVAAEYHEISPVLAPTGTNPYNVHFNMERIPGKVTKGEPACPPNFWEGGYKALKAKLPGGCV